VITFDLVVDREPPAEEFAVFVAEVLGVRPEDVHVGPKGTDPGGPAPRVWCWCTTVEGEFHWNVEISAADDVPGPDELTFARLLSRRFAARVLLGTESPSYQEWRLVTAASDEIVHLDMAEVDNDRFVLAPVRHDDTW
jgi:hypothetical protein